LWNYQKMRPVRIAVALTILCSSTIGAADVAAGKGQLGHCSGRKERVGECYKIRGRLRAYAGYPRCRIWPIGTNHLLGIADPSELPSNIACGNGFEVFADFVVCPLVEVRSGGMQMICVANASNIRASEVRVEDKR
jgi:hypothetical protein